MIKKKMYYSDVKYYYRDYNLSKNIINKTTKATKNGVMISTRHYLKKKKIIKKVW